MTHIVLDYTYIQALINENNENHEKAVQLSELIHDQDWLYVPNHVLVLLLEENKEYIKESQKLYYLLSEVTRIDCSPGKRIYNESYEQFKTLNNINYNDCLTITYMKHKELKYILSFNEKFDEIKGIKRLYKTNDYNTKQLNYYT